MSGVSVEIDISQVAEGLGRLNVEEIELLAYEIGALIEDQTKLRIDEEKASPDGVRWLPWSEAYDESRNHAKHSLLVGEGNFRDSLQNLTTGLEAVVGTNLVYGAVHQLGSDTSKRPDDAGEGWGIPARPYLGVSDENRIAIEELVVGRLEDLLQ